MSSWLLFLISVSIFPPHPSILLSLLLSSTSFLLFPPSFSPSPFSLFPPLSVSVCVFASSFYSSIHSSILSVSLPYDVPGAVFLNHEHIFPEAEAEAEAEREELRASPLQAST